MKRVFAIFLASLGICSGASAQTSPIFENFGTINTPPQIDAIAFANYGVMELTSGTGNFLFDGDGGFFFGSGLIFGGGFFAGGAGLFPFDFQSTQYYTNRGVMRNTGGFIFDTASSREARRRAAHFVNHRTGVIEATSQYGLLLVDAANIEQYGRMAVGNLGVLKLAGQTVNLTRAGMEVLSPGPGAFAGGFRGETNFFPESGLVDNYAFITNQEANVFTPFTSDFATIVEPGQYGEPDVISVATPVHLGLTPGAVDPTPRTIAGQTTNVHARVVGLDGTNQTVQLVFVLTDPADELETTVRFGPPELGDLRTAYIEVLLTETNVATGDLMTNRLYLVDELAINTNAVLLSNITTFAPTSARPAPYNITRTTPLGFGSFETGIPFDENFLTNAITEGADGPIGVYASYGFTLGVETPVSPEMEIEDVGGRVEITASDLDLTRTRIRGNNLVSIQTENLISSAGAIVDTRDLRFDLAVRSGTLLIDNLARDEVRRFGGSARMWSAFWTNVVEIPAPEAPPAEPDQEPPPPGEASAVQTVFHISVVDLREFQTSVPVITHDLFVRGDQVVIADPMRVVRGFRVDSERLTLREDLQLYDRVDTLSAANFPRVQFFTNEAALFVENTANFGRDRNLAYTSWINSGTLDTTGLNIFTDYFGNSGTILAEDDGVSISSRIAELTGGLIEARTDINITADQLTASDTELSAGGMIQLNVRSLRDAGPDSNNLLEVSDGVQFNGLESPASLVGTTIHTYAPRFRDVPHVFSADLSLRELILDGDREALLQFQGTRPVVLSVGFLRLEGVVGQVVQQLFDEVDGVALGDVLALSNVTLRFGDSNVPVEELAALSVQLVWDPSLVPAPSMVNVVIRSSGETVQMSRELRESETIDSDGDGIPNKYDAYPLDSDAFPVAVQAPADDVISFSWQAAANSVYRIEFTTSLANPTWELLRNYSNSSGSAIQATVQESISRAESQRYFRIRQVQ